MSKLLKGSIAVLCLAAFTLTCVHILPSEKTLIAESLPSASPSKKKKTPDERARFADERAKFEFDMLKDPNTGTIPIGIREKEIKQASRAPELSQHLKGTGFTVTPRGPNNLGGRTRAIAFDLSDATNNTILAGGVSSGVFRTTNLGGSWTKVSPNDEIHNVTAIAQDPRSGQQNVWYYGTGEGLGNSASLGSAYRGFGVWKSTNSGLNWSRLTNSSPGALETFECVDYMWRLAVDPTNGNVYAAVPNAIIRSTDGGGTWNTVLGGSCGSSIAVQTDIVISSTGTIYVAFSGEAGSANDGVWVSTTGGGSGSYSRIAGNSSPAGWNAPADYGRVVLALAPSNENILFALYDNETSINCGGTPAPEADLFRYDASITTWTNLSANLPDETGCLAGNDPFAIQGGYDLCVAVKPDDPNTVFIGGTNAYRSTDGFSSTSNTSRIGGYVSSTSFGLYANHHPDIHILLFAPNTGGSFDKNEILFSGTDGGIHRGDITETTVSWTSMNNDYVTYQYYHSAISPTIGSNTLIGGTQDNGTTETTAGTSHSRILGGDGVAVGMANGGTYYIGTQNGSIRRYTGSSTTITPTGSNSIFVTYFYLDPDNTEYLYYASRESIYRTTSASTVNSGSWDEMTGVDAATSDDIRALATSRGSGYASSDANRKLYIGTADGEVFRLNDPAFTGTGTSPVNITPPGASAGVVSSISVNPSDDNEIIVTYSNYGINSVYHTSNANDATPTWANIEGNIPLPSFRSSTIVDAGGGVSYYLVGTSVGLYCTQNLSWGSTVWSQIGPSDIGYALVSQLAIRPADNFLVAGTHGNGMYMIEAPSVPNIAFSTVSSSSTENSVNTTSCRDYEDITVSMLITLAPSGAATVTISNTGTATEGVDYDILNAGKQVIFPDGSTASQNVNIRIYDDNNPEGDETIILDFTVSGTTDAEKSSSNATHTLTISDNDFIPGSTISVWEEDFEGGITIGGFASTDWASGRFGSLPFNSAWRVGANGGMSGSQSAYVSEDNGASTSYNEAFAQDLIFRTEQIDGSLFSDMSLNFDFKANGDAGNDYGTLMYSLTGTNFFTIEGTSIAPYTGVPTSTNRTVALPAALNNQMFYIGFRWIQNDDGVGNDPPFTIDNLLITTEFEPAIETVLNSSDEQYFGPNETVNFFIGGDLIATLKNNSTYDYGCTTVTIDREGTSAETAWSAVTGEELASKTVLITPTNNSPGAGESYDLTLYYTQAEFDGWVNNSDVTHTTGDFKLVKSNGAIKDLTVGSTNASVNASTSYAAYGTDHSFTATFDNGFSGFGGGDPSDPAFPVEFISFTGKQLGAQVQLDWSTSLEINSDRFEIERSGDGISFSRIGSVASTGGENGEDYRFFDQTPLAGMNVYRLRQVDLDGKYDYSPKVEVNFRPVLEARISPNPFQEHFFLELSDEGKQIYEFELFDVKGKLVLEKRLEFSDRLYEKIETTILPPGQYLYILRKRDYILSGKLLKN